MKSVSVGQIWERVKSGRIWVVLRVWDDTVLVGLLGEPEREMHELPPFFKHFFCMERCPHCDEQNFTHRAWCGDANGN
jgi:hypothetical protein